MRKQVQGQEWVQLAPRGQDGWWAAREVAQRSMGRAQRLITWVTGDGKESEMDVSPVRG